MHILYLHQYFITRETQGGTRSYEFARYFVRKGHRVTMLTSGRWNPQFPVNGERFRTYRHEGIEIKAIDAGYANARKGTALSGYQRMMQFLQFASLAKKVGKTLERPDVVYATHTPLTIGLPGEYLSRYFKVPFIFEVRDLWPEALVNIGVLTNPLAIFYFKYLSKRFYHRAAHVIALSPGMKQVILNYGVKGDKVSVIPNSSDLDLFRPDITPAYNDVVRKINGRFSAIYFGAMGKANGLDYVLQAAVKLKKEGELSVVFILHGDGSEKDRLKAEAQKQGLDNIIFSDPVPKKEDLAKLIKACDACMTIYQSDKEQTWSPNKMFDSLAAGKPVLINVGGWLGETIEKNKCGFQTSPDSPAELAEVMKKLEKDRKLVKEMGKNSRRLAEEKFDRNKLALELEKIFIKQIKKYTNGN